VDWFRQKAVPTMTPKLPLPTEELAIGFVNTVAWRLRSPTEERLDSPETLLVWLEQNDLLSGGERRRMARGWTTRPRDAAAVYETALRLREAIYELLLSLTKRKRPAAAALKYFGDFVSHPPSSSRLQWRHGRLTWCGKTAPRNAHDLLQPIVWSAAELLTGSRAVRIKQCQDDRGCGWLFVDESRLQNRRWCSMGDCGNVAKARRHRHRTRPRGA
jgi:predicted RNA-binding Zn ribbon-like protein